MEEKDNEEIEIRIILKENARDEEDRELFKIFKEISEHLTPLKASNVTKFLIMRAYEHWFKKEIKKD